MSEEIVLYLNSQQYKKLQSNKAIQLKYAELLESVSKHKVIVKVTKKFAKKFHRALISNKGIRLNKDSADIIGGSLNTVFRSISKSIPKSFVRDAAKVVETAAIARVGRGASLGKLARSVGKVATKR